MFGAEAKLLILMKEDILTTDSNAFLPEKPRVWIAKLRVRQNGLANEPWDLAPDGKRVVVVTPIESTEAPKQEHEVVFLENFFDELRRKVPAVR
jgi:hypothetical protein